MKGGRCVRYKKTSISIVLVTLSFLTCLYYYNQGYHALSQMEGICHAENKQLSLGKIIPIQWDTLYIVYGPSLSEFLEWDYDIKSDGNTTQEKGISLYFVLNKKVVYIENDDDYKEQREKKFGYIRFQDNTYSSRGTSRSTPAAIYIPSTILKKINKNLLTDGEPDVCELIPLDQYLSKK